jgi:hypothetical protein
MTSGFSESGGLRDRGSTSTVADCAAARQFIAVKNRRLSGQAFLELQ